LTNPANAADTNSGSIEAEIARARCRLDNVTLVLLGLPACRSAAGEVALAPERRFQLLAYLARRDTAVTCAQLASLFWPDRLDKTVHTNLRYTLLQLKQVTWLVGWEAQGESLWVSLDTDLKRFAEALRVGNRQAAVTSYRGKLLEGFEGDASEPFVEWLAQERKRWHDCWRDHAMELLAAAELPLPHAIELAERLLAEDPFDEPALRELMRLLDRAGRASQVQLVLSNARAAPSG
jgi:DNA-binding SARP family transcriptional activator